MTSLKRRCFTDLAETNDDVLSKNYVHGAIETWKFKGATKNGSKWEYKAKIKHKVENKQISGNLSDELKLQFPLGGYTWWLGKRGNELKIAADLGEVEVGGQQVNLFTNLKTQTNFKDFAFRFGTNYTNDKTNINTRIDTTCQPGQSSKFGLTNRLYHSQDNIFFALVTSFGLNNGLALKQYDAIFGFEKDDLSVYVQHDSKKNSGKIAPGVVTATVAHSHKKEVFGLEVSKDFKKGDVSAQFGFQTKVNDDLVKAKINNTLNLQFAYKRALNDSVSLTASGALDLSKKAKALNFQNYLPFPIGFEFEVKV